MSSPDPASVSVPAAYTAVYWSYVDRPPGPDSCWPWTGTVRPSGRAVNTAPVTDPADPQRVTYHTFDVRRFAWILSRRQDPGRNARIATSCGNRLCCRPKHLTAQPLGIPADLHDWIRAESAAGRSGRDIARQLRVRAPAVSAILRNPAI